MSHTYAHNPVHIVFSTKGRRKLISKQLQPNLWAYLAGVCKKQRSSCMRSAAWKTTFTC
jgi:REP element-mobilizing transposase RayT